MRIAFVISSLQVGGAEKVLTKLANHYAENNHHVSLVTFQKKSTPSFYLLNKNIEVYALDCLLEGAPSFLKRFYALFQRVSLLRKTFKKLSPELIISFVDITNITTLCAAYGLKIPVIVSERTHPAYHQLSKFYQKARLLTYRWAFRIVVQTASVAEYFPDFLKSKIEIIPNPVEVPLSQIPSLNRTKRIVTLGRLRSYKGFDTLIKAFSEVQKEYKDWQLYIYGEGEERQNLEMLVSSLKLEKKTFLPGETKDVWKVLNSASLFVLPSHFEGFPNALCEAMVAGLPVIASDCSGNRDIIISNKNGKLFPIGDYQALTQAMKELIQDESLRKKLAQEAKNLSKQVDEKKVFSKWRNLTHLIEKKEESNENN
jgi:glycosyltransferase involved in cell wall biosynthesis